MIWFQKIFTVSGLTRANSATTSLIKVKACSQIHKITEKNSDKMRETLWTSMGFILKVRKEGRKDHW